jgi:hypothetical protein
LLSHPYATLYDRVGPVLAIGLPYHNLSFQLVYYIFLSLVLSDVFVLRAKRGELPSQLLQSLSIAIEHDSAECVVCVCV